MYLYPSGLTEPPPSSWFKPLSYTPHMRPRMGRCGTKTAQNRVLKTKTKRKYALTDPFCCQRRQAASWLRQQNAPPQILVHCQCLEKNQDITHTGGPTLSTLRRNEIPAKPRFSCGCGEMKQGRFFAVLHFLWFFWKTPFFSRFRITKNGNIWRRGQHGRTFCGDRRPCFS